jgi:hypothetical protein
VQDLDRADGSAREQAATSHLSRREKFHARVDILDCFPVFKQQNGEVGTVTA